MSEDTQPLNEKIKPIDPVEAPVVEAVSNYTQTEPYSTVEFTFDEDDEVVNLPSANFSATRKVLENTPLSSIGSDKNTELWANIINEGLPKATYSDDLKGTVSREGATFEQNVKTESGVLKSTFPKPKLAEGAKPTGEASLTLIRSAMGLGVPFSVPLWHSGFWLVIKPPSEAQLLELYRKISSEKVSLGRSTYGFMFSNGTSYTTNTLLNFAMENLHSSSLVLKEGEDLRSFIDVRDTMVLTYALACAVWPNGFQIQRGCIADPEKCKHIVKELLNLSKLQITDTSALTERQKIHMSKRMRNSVDSESVKRYKEEFIRGQDKEISLGKDKLKIILKIPSIMDHIEAGYRWINSIEETYGNALEQSEDKRENYIISQAKATAMRQYAHFVKAIVVGEHVEDEVTIIEQALNDLTSKDSIRNEFIDKTKEFIDNSMVSLIAIPTYVCPACGKDQVDKRTPKYFTNLIPLDCVSVFFTLLSQRLQKIELR
jgi:hypothetical protein